MKKPFENRIQAIDWMAEHAMNEEQFEIWREQLTFNYIYTGIHYLEFDEKDRHQESNLVLLSEDS